MYGGFDAQILRANITSDKSVTINISIDIYATILHIERRKESFISIRITRSKLPDWSNDGYVWPK